MSLTGKRSAILVEQQYQELEVWYPYYRLKEEGCDIDFVGPIASNVYPSKFGYPVTSTVAAAEAEAAAYDVLIIPGGFAPDFMRRHPAMIEFASAMYTNGKLVAAICHGPWILCSIKDVLPANWKATSFYAIKDDLVNAGADYQDAAVVYENNLITSRTPDDLPAFMKKIIEVLTSQ